MPKLPGAKTKNLFLRDKKGRRHLLVTVPHDIAVDLDALAAVLGVGGVGLRVGRAAAEIPRASRRARSACWRSSTTRRTRVEFVIDRALWEADAVHAHPLVNTATMVIPHADLERFLAATGHRAARDRRPGGAPR